MADNAAKSVLLCMEDVTPICGDPECGGCPSPLEMEWINAQMYENDKRNANLALGLPEFFNVDRSKL